MTSQKNYKNIVINSLPEREVEILGAITAEKMADMRSKAIAKLKEVVEIPGFRKGNAPENLIAQKVGEGRLLEEAAEIALSEEYPQILEENNIDAIGRPEISIIKIGVGSELEFKIKTFLMPDVKLGDYKKLAKKENSEKTDAPIVAEKEVDEVIKNIQKNIAHQKWHAEHPENTEHGHGEVKDEDLPPLDENFVKLLGDFKDAEDLKSKIKENIVAEKTIKNKDKKRTAILEAVMGSSTIDLPKIIIDGEMDKMLGQLKDDIARAGANYEEYLTHIKKTEEDLKTEWKDVAVKRAKSQVILNTIAKDENITAKEEDIKKEMENILAQHKDAERFRVRMYVETFLANELVFQFLEQQ